MQQSLTVIFKYSWIASTPLFASIILNPFCVKTYCKKLLIKGSSSTIKIWGQQQFDVVKGGIIQFSYDSKSWILSDISYSIIGIILVNFTYKVILVPLSFSLWIWRFFPVMRAITWL